jgi:hypothetical protein
MMEMKEKSESGGSVATILGRELEPTIKEWLRRVNLVPELIQIPLSDKDRTRHLPGHACRGVPDISGRHFPNITSSPWRTRPETVASRRNCHRGRGGRATQGSGAQLDSKDALPALAPALDCKNAGAFQSSLRSFPCPQPKWSNRGMSNPTETEILAMEFDAVLSVQVRVGFSTVVPGWRVGKAGRQLQAHANLRMH